MSLSLSPRLLSLILSCTGRTPGTYSFLPYDSNLADELGLKGGQDALLNFALLGGNDYMLPNVSLPLQKSVDLGKSMNLSEFNVDQLLSKIEEHRGEITDMDAARRGMETAIKQFTPLSESDKTEYRRRSELTSLYAMTKCFDSTSRPRTLQPSKDAMREAMTKTKAHVMEVMRTRIMSLHGVHGKDYLVYISELMAKMDSSRDIAATDEASTWVARIVCLFI